MALIYLVRHGQTQFNVARRAQGALDSALTALGEGQAAAVGRLLRSTLADPHNCPVVSSPLGRATHTARIIRQTLAAAGPPAEDPRLREVSMGQFEGMTYDEVDARWPGTTSSGDHWMFSAVGAERLDDAADRLSQWLMEARALPGELVAVSHGVAGRLLRGLVMGLSRTEALVLPIPQDAVFRIAGDRVERLDCETLEQDGAGPASLAFSAPRG